MSLFVDTSVWSHALRRDASSTLAHVDALARALNGGETILTTGLVLQQLLQGFSGPKHRNLILDRFSTLSVITPTRENHVSAGELRNHCRRRGVQIGTIDALLAQLCIAHDLTMLTTDENFQHVSRHSALVLWRS